MSFFFLFFFFLLFGLDEKLEKRRREREKEKKREDLPYYYDDDDEEVFLREIYDRKGTRQRKECADGLSEFDFFFLLLKIPTLASCDDYTHIERERL